MTAAEWGVLLLCCALPGEEKPLSLPQFQELGRRARALGCRGDDPLRELTARDLARLGYDAAQSARITRLLAREAQLEQYLRAAAAQGITAEETAPQLSRSRPMPPPSPQATRAACSCVSPAMSA